MKLLIECKKLILQFCETNLVLSLPNPLFCLELLKIKVDNGLFIKGYLQVYLKVLGGEGVVTIFVRFRTALFYG